MSELAHELAAGLHKSTEEGVLGTWRGLEVGVWEAAPGVDTDTEADEVFVVLEGSATIEFVSPARPAIEIGPGDVVRLEEGMETVWTVHEHLRKVYLS
jgi:uncharacterized cupin superfamily protein